MKKKAKKAKKPKKKTNLDELETVTFEQQIVDNNRQIARLKTRNDELEAEADNLKDRLQQLEESKIDLTTYLEEVLKKKSQEAQELQERVKALENLRLQEQQDFKKREDSLEQEFKLMEKNLTAEIKLAAGKLNALEDWRLARIDLMKKFDEQEKQMAEQEQRHKETLYETEKKFITGKAKMQSELERRITELADNFRKATGLRLADATQRAVRENMSLRRELDQLLSQCSKLDDESRECQERERDARLKAELYEVEAKLALGKVIRQRQLLIKLLKEDEEASREASRLIKAEHWSRQVNQATSLNQRANIELEDRINELEKEARLGRQQVTEEAKQARDYRNQLRRLENVLEKTRNAVIRALEMHPDGYEEEADEDNDSCSACIIEAKEELLMSLYQILRSYDAPRIMDEDRAKKESKLEDSLYEFGYLGLIPSYDESSRTITSDQQISGDDVGEREDLTTSTTTECSVTLLSGHTSDSQFFGDC